MQPLSDLEMKQAAYEAQQAASTSMCPANAWVQGDLVFQYLLQQLNPVLEQLIQQQDITNPMMNQLEGFPHGYIQEVRKHLSQLTEALYTATAAIHRIADAPNAPQEAVSSMPSPTLGLTIGSALRR